MKYTIFILLLIISKGAIAQDIKSQDLVGIWKLDWVNSGFFPDDDLLFERTEATGMYNFEFKENGEITNEVPDSPCPVGDFYISEGKWKYKNGYLTLKIKAYKVADNSYSWIVRYKVEKQENRMWLRVDNVIENKEGK